MLSTEPGQRLRFDRWIAIGFALLAYLVLLTPAASAQTTLRIGYVDMERLLTQAPQILSARTRLQKEFDARDAELRLDSARLAELDLRVKQATEAAERTDLSRQADALRRSIERTRQRLREELNARVDEETEKAWPQINDAIAILGREQGYDLIVTSPVAYVSGRIDVTDDVLARLARDSDTPAR
jgi:outer membrane protein